MRNVPARQRFSNPPAFLVQKNRKKKQQQQERSSTVPTSSTTTPATAPTTTARQRVVDRMAHRLVAHPPAVGSGGANNRHRRNAASAATGTFRGRVEDLDSLHLSDGAVEKIYSLLAARGVIQQQQQHHYFDAPLMGGVGAEPSDDEDEFDSDEFPHYGESENGDNQPDDSDADYVDGEDEDDGENGVPDDRISQHSQTNHLGRFTYDESTVEDADYGAMDAPYQRSGSHVQDHFQTDWEGSVVKDVRTVHSSIPLIGATTNDDGPMDDSSVAFRSDPVFRYLTNTLSFSDCTASRACRSLEGWQGSTASKAHGSSGGGGVNGGGVPSSSSPDGEAWTVRLGLAVDWLSLHLEEAELTSGFRRNVGPPSGSGKLPLPTTTTTTIYSAVPHPSISVAPRLTEDAAFLRRIRLDERSLGFVQLGFPYTDVISVLEKQSNDARTSEAINDDATLLDLLSKVEAELHRPALDVEPVDQGVLLEEREQEMEVLAAVYDTEFEIVSQTSDLCSRYKIRLPGMASIVVGRTDSDEETHLHVFLRPGYPHTETPLILFTLPHCDVLLLRKINRAIVRHVEELRGTPCIFEAATYLTANLESIVADHRKELRAKEFDEQQRRMRDEVDRGLGSSGGADDEPAHMGRRQLAKLKSEERSYDASQREELKQVALRQQQEKRLQRIKEQDRSLRQSMADAAIQRRERERLEDGVRAVGRRAMLSALNHGASPEEARLASEKAQLAYKEEHGLVERSIKQKSGEEHVDETCEESTLDHDQTTDDGNHVRSKPHSTPTTSAFVERLRAMYNSAANGSNVVRLSAEEKPVNQSRLPSPIATYSGELASVIDDVVSIQTAQPWLISQEARVPQLDAKDATNKESEQSQVNPDDLSLQLKQELEQMYSKPRFKKILEQRKRLPAFQMKENLVRTIAASQVTVVSGETGCGKSLCTPQVVLDDMIRRKVGSHANIIVTQPRRISAVGVAERIAFERLESVGETCGYSIKLEKKISRRTRILLCTTGILLRRLQCDPDLATVSHVFLDEVHERDLNTDFLLIILKDLLIRRPSLKLVLMSATLNAESFVNYFPGCQSVSISGRAHPVKEHRLEDVLQLTGYEVPQNSDYAKKSSANGAAAGRLSTKELRKLYPNCNSSVLKSLSIVNESVINYELLALLLRHIVENNEEQGAILVFLPGLMEITKAFDEIRKIEMFQSSRFRIYPLHSSLATAEQLAVFEVPPSGVRKIVLATNIAETSITIEGRTQRARNCVFLHLTSQRRFSMTDVVFVVDCGRVKENRRDEVKETPALVECWVSRASAKQRRGRAGRVRPGVAYHMYSRYARERTFTQCQRINPNQYFILLMFQPYTR